MRYYDIVISATPGGPPVQLQARAPNGSALPGAPVQSTARWTSHPNGLLSPPNAGALDVEIDLYLTAQATPDTMAGGSTISIWGVDLATLQTAVQFAGAPRGNPAKPEMFISVKGGMGRGLPLANPAQAGLLVSGAVWQATGSWQGTEQKIDLLLNPGGASIERPINLSLNWQQGQPLAPALQQCLATAFPNTKVIINISPNLVAPAPMPHFARTLTELFQFLTNYTQSLQGPGSLGVRITPRGSGFLVFDGTVPVSTGFPKTLVFADLHGQPTWRDANTLWLETTMRADISVGDIIAMPPEIMLLGALALQPLASFPSLRKQNVIQGAFMVIQMRHWGRFRDPDGTQWSTGLICIPVPPGPPPQFGA